MVDSFPFASCVIPFKLYFGGYPSVSMWNKIRQSNVSIMVDLTSKEEKGHFDLFPYFRKEHMSHSCSIRYINYPIQDKKCPIHRESFQRFLYHLLQIGCMQTISSACVYIHCRGGHGRSGMVVACLLTYLYNITPIEAIRKTTLLHRQRSDLRSYRRWILCPNSVYQRQFVLDQCSSWNLDDLQRESSIHRRRCTASAPFSALETFLWKSFPHPLLSLSTRTIISSSSPWGTMSLSYWILRHYLLYSQEDPQYRRRCMIMVFRVPLFYLALSENVADIYISSCSL